jgi:hypothetical protein
MEPITMMHNKCFMNTFQNIPKYLATVKRSWDELKNGLSVGDIYVRIYILVDFWSL